MSLACPRSYNQVKSWNLNSVYFPNFPIVLSKCSIHIQSRPVQIQGPSHKQQQTLIQRANPLLPNRMASFCKPMEGIYTRNTCSVLTNPFSLFPGTQCCPNRQSVEKGLNIGDSALSKVVIRNRGKKKKTLIHTVSSKTDIKRFPTFIYFLANSIREIQKYLGCYARRPEGHFLTDNT